MAQAIVLRDPGDASVLRMENVPVGAPGPGELRVRQTAIGVNFHDIYVRSGLYKTLPLPGIPGIEAAGVVEAVGMGGGRIFRSVTGWVTSPRNTAPMRLSVSCSPIS
jgi:NADPH2:quinone reductase